MKYEYPVLAFRQQPKAPIQVAFVAPAAEVTEWSGVPRKSDELLTGFQRFRDNDRVDQQIVPFFSNPANCSPTAIIVALRQDSGLGRCKLLDADIPAGTIKETKLIIEVDQDKFGTEEVFHAALNYVATRVDKEEPELGDAQDTDETEDELIAEEAEEAEDADDDVNIVHLGRETLTRMKALLEDKNNWGNPKFLEAIQDYVKPAFLIDGQHRVAAAARFGQRGLPFIVCGLYDAPWEEQVFQFTVVNVKPKKIAPSLIASIAALSLSKAEQGKLQSRLDQAGIRMDEVEIMSLIAYDDASPFSGFVDMGVGAQQVRVDKLGYGGMKRIARVWYTARRNSLTQIAKQLYMTNSGRKGREAWRTNRDWFEFFCLFWKTVRSFYSDDLWQKRDGNKLFIGAHLWALQEAILSEADGQMQTFWKLGDEIEDRDTRKETLEQKLVEVTRSSLTYIPEDLWTIEWTKGSQDTNSGREELMKLFGTLIDEGKKQGKVWKQWRTLDWFAKKDKA